MSIRIFNDPGVYVVKAMKPVASTPVLPAQPTAFIGPMYQIVDQEVDTLTEAVLTEDLLVAGNAVTIPYPSLISEDSKIDTDSVKVEAIRTDGRSKDITDLCTISATSVSIDYNDDDVQLAVEELNELWGGNSTKGEYRGVNNVPIHISYRALREDLVGRVLEAQGADGVLVTIGKGIPENPLGLAGMIGARLTNSAMLFVPTSDNVEADVTSALNLLESRNVYSPVVLSSSTAAQQQVIAHADMMTSVDEQKERFAWTAVDIPDASDLDVSPTATTLEIKTAQKEFLKSYAGSIYNKNAAVVYQPFSINIDGDIVELPSYYLAAAYAALKSQIPPQQGLTNYPLGGLVNKLHYGNDYFKPSELKELSQAGVFVCTQEVEGGPIKSRFQVTTNMANNKTKQVSLQYCVSYFSEAYRRTKESLIGVNNVTDDILETIALTTSVFLGEMKAAGIIVRGSVVSINQHPDNEAQVNVVLDVSFSTPLDVIAMQLNF